MYKSNLLNRVLSILLVLVMVFTFLPTSRLEVFANSMVNGKVGTDILTSSGKGDNDKWGSHPSIGNMWGYRISIWYAPQTGYDSAKEPIYDWENAFPVGRTEYYRDSYFKNTSASPAFWGSEGAYKLVNGMSTWSNSKTTARGNNRFYCWYLNSPKEESSIDVSSKLRYDQFKDLGLKAGNTKGHREVQDFVNRIYDMDLQSVNSEGFSTATPENPTKKLTPATYNLAFPKLMSDSNSTKGTMNASNTYLKSYFLNPSVLNMLIWTTTSPKAEIGQGAIEYEYNVGDFVFGRLRGRDGTYKYTQGQFKIYVEPVAFRQYNYVPGVMSYTDMVSEMKEKGKVGSAAAYGMGVGWNSQIGGALSLEAPDSTLGVTSLTMDWETSRNNLNNPHGKWILTSPSLNSYAPPPEVVKTYVMVTSVDADGTVHYKKAAPTTKESAQFNLDAGGNISQVPIFENIEGAEGGQAILNDIISTDKDLTVESNTEWVDTKLPVNIGVELKESSEDIAGYLTGIVTGSELFIETYNQSVVVDTSVIASLNAVKEVYDTLVEQNAGVANETTTIISTNLTRADSSSVLIKVVDAVPYVYFGQVKLGKIVDGRVEKIIDETADNTGGLGIVTPANNLILRYILKPTPKQVNVIEIVDENGSSSFVNGGSQDLAITDTTVTIQKPNLDNMDKLLGEPEKVEWVTNSEYPIADISKGVLPPKSPDGESGGPETDTIIDYPKDPLTHNLYVKWRVMKDNPETKDYRVPEWRLSKFWGAVSGVPSSIASMNLPIRYGCCSTTLSPSGAWNYTTRNPNGQLTLPGHLPDNLKLLTWVHSETVHSGSTPSISLSNPGALVPISGNLNAIKSTDTSGLKVANWLDKGSVAGLLKYDVQNGNKGTAFSKNEYSLSTALGFGAYNLDTYTNGYTVPIYSKRGHRHSWSYQTISPPSASYGIFPMGINVTFDRYVQKNTDAQKLKVQPEIKSDNGFTSIKYQDTTTLNIYPEYGMLFANDANAESIKWIVGDQARKVNPVIWQTLEHKVYVKPTSNGTSVATDTRAKSNAQKIGEVNKQVIYKGAGVNTNFNVFKDADVDSKGILTVKTFALDFDSSANVKGSWGNGG